MKKKLFLMTLVGGSLVLGGCLSSSQVQKDQIQPSAASQIEEKQGDTTLTGVISVANGIFYITPGGQPTQEIESYSVELGEYVGKTVTVTGQFSGDTLFIGSIQ